jgi:hypothetical protein
MRGAGKRWAPTTPRGSKTAHADILIISSSPSARRRPAPPGQSTVFTEREPAGGRGGCDGPKNCPIGDAVIGVSDRLPGFRRSALTTLIPHKSSVCREEKNTPAKLGHPRVPDRDGEISRDRPVSFAPILDLHFTPERENSPLKKPSLT